MHPHCPFPAGSVKPVVQGVDLHQGSIWVQPLSRVTAHFVVCDAEKREGFGDAHCVHQAVVAVDDKVQREVDARGD